MFLTLQDDDGSYETMRATMEDVLPPGMVALLSPRGTEWDTPIDGDAFAVPAVPGAEVYNLRARRSDTPPAQRPRLRTTARLGLRAAMRCGRRETKASIASAATTGRWPARSRRTAARSLANDMHLDIRVPNTWYRASLEWPDRSDGAAAARRRHAAGRAGARRRQQRPRRLGLHQHLRRLERSWCCSSVDPADATRYRTPDGWRTFERYEETLAVAGGASERETVRWTIWGPVLADGLSRPAARDPMGRALGRAPGESASRRSRRPGRSTRRSTPPTGSARPGRTSWRPIAAAGSAGRWTAPSRGASASTATCPCRGRTARAAGTAGSSAAEYPRVVGSRRAAASGPPMRAWSAARCSPRWATAATRSARGRASIRDRLMAHERFTPRDMLAIQLDTRADFLARWRDLSLRTLTPRRRRRQR